MGRVERRRRFSVEQKLAILSEASADGANVSLVARRYGLLPSQVFKWRRLAELGVISIPGASELPSFVAMQVATDMGAPMPEPASPPVVRGRRRSGVIEIDLGSGRRLKVDSDVDAAALARVLDVLDRR